MSHIFDPFSEFSPSVQWCMPFILPFTTPMLHFFQATLTFLAFSTQLFRTSCSLIFSACHLSWPWLLAKFAEVWENPEGAGNIIGEKFAGLAGACQVPGLWNTLHCVCSSIALIFLAPLLLMVICDFFFGYT